MIDRGALMHLSGLRSAALRTSSLFSALARYIYILFEFSD